MSNERPGYFSQKADGKMKLTLTAMPYRRDEISVVQDGVPIPYEWTGPLEITVDDIYERAAIQITPKPRTSRDRDQGER